ncbi:MAG: efflux transporter outer membrane subunit [Betaproteobacteria bacterium]|nr:efflux transporter outer membrane subunit [Betaproteobacteria bacterium]
MIARRCTIAATALLLGACAAGPNYTRPSVDVPGAYKQLPDTWRPAEPRDQINRGRWWEIYGDPELNTLADRAIAANHDLRVAAAQYRQASAMLRASRSGLYPVAEAGVSWDRGRGSTTLGSRASSSGGVASQRSLSLDASWEADLWGRVRRTVESAEAYAEAIGADLESVRLSLVAQLAQSYFQLRAADTQKALFDDTVAAYERSLELVRNRYAVGVASKAEVAQARTQLMSAQAQAIDIDLQRTQLEHAIAVLVGEAPANFSLPRSAFAASVPAVPVGVPSELLERRPDVAAAERRVAAANAQIGIARAARFPSLVLTASGGFESASFATWLTTPSRFWALGAAAVQTLFDGGLRGAQVEQAEAGFEAAAEQYRQIVLNGFREVEDALAAVRLLEREAAVQSEAVAAARESVRLTENAYRAGTVSFQNVINVQTAALANERAANDIQARHLVASTQLIRVLGGGWDGLQSAR